MEGERGKFPSRLREGLGVGQCVVADSPTPGPSRKREGSHKEKPPSRGHWDGGSF